MLVTKSSKWKSPPQNGDASEHNAEDVGEGEGEACQAKQGGLDGLCNLTFKLSGGSWVQVDFHTFTVSH